MVAFMCGEQCNRLERNFFNKKAPTFASSEIYQLLCLHAYTDRYEFNFPSVISRDRE